jgi:ABC-type multidrug transport system fused ATPase/permease subunit
MHFTLSRKLKMLIPFSRRPILELATSTEAGLMTIRAFGRSQFYVERMYDLIDDGTKVGWHLALGIRWSHIRLGFMGAMFVTITAASLVFQRIDASMAGFIIILALQLKSTLAITLRKMNVLDMGYNALSRVLTLADTPTESRLGKDPPESWPIEGAIEVHDVTVHYNAAPTAALKDISFSLKSRQRLGIIGRTGAGKTSLTNAFLRFINITEGNILIDGLDISTIPLAKLRSAVTIIPQDPFLFSGTLRSNLDLYGNKSDGELQSVLRRVRLISNDNNEEDYKFTDLNMTIGTGGVNLSHGQRQLVCLARAMLARCRVLILDESTSAVDSATDTAIQKVIRDEFAEATILVVAHKLVTVADFDSIIVLSNGEKAEFGSPAELMTNRGIFWDMVRQSGYEERIKSIIGV